MKIIRTVRAAIINPQKPGFFLFIVNPDTKKYYPGLCTIPGGVIEDDEDIVDAIAREVFNETGLCITEDSILGFLSQTVRTTDVVLETDIVLCKTNTIVTSPNPKHDDCPKSCFWSKPEALKSKPTPLLKSILPLLLSP